MTDSPLLSNVQNELKNSVRQLLSQLHTDRPSENLYAVLFEVDVSQTYAFPIAGSEEGLTRLCESYAAKGYRIQSGDLMESLRAMLRWDAPGDNCLGWYWTATDNNRANRAVEQAVHAGLIREFDGAWPLAKLSLQALRELDDEGAFGRGPMRERILIGTTCCELDFAAESKVLELATLNPAQTIASFRRDITAAEKADKLLIRPWDRSVQTGE